MTERVKAILLQTKINELAYDFIYNGKYLGYHRQKSINLELLLAAISKNQSEKFEVVCTDIKSVKIIINKSWEIIWFYHYPFISQPEQTKELLFKYFEIPNN